MKRYAWMMFINGECLGDWDICSTFDGAIAAAKKHKQTHIHITREDRKKKFEVAIVEVDFDVSKRETI